MGCQHFAHQQIKDSVWFNMIFFESYSKFYIVILCICCFVVFQCFHFCSHGGGIKWQSSSWTRPMSSLDRRRKWEKSAHNLPSTEGLRRSFRFRRFDSIFLLLNSEYNSNFSFLVVWFFRSKSLFHEFLDLTYIILEGVYPRTRSVPHQRNTGNTENITSGFLWPNKTPRFCGHRNIDSRKTWRQSRGRLQWEWIGDSDLAILGIARR